MHIDCNSYFASCEIATRPGLEGKPVVVANGNENGGGVVLALNAEAKALGLQRGVPLFKVRETLKAQGVEVCSADHKKYRRISASIMQGVLEQGIVQNFVQYSVDEFFGTLPVEEPAEVRRYVGLVKELIWEQNHIPVGCGCSQTYTLAKVATHFAKHYPGYGGICVLPAEKRERALAMLAVGEVWGVGRRNRPRLEAAGIRTALDLARCDEATVAGLLNTAGVRTWRELRGEPAVVLANHDRQKSIMQSRTFAAMTSDYGWLENTIAAFASQCAATMRAQKGICKVVSVFLSTNRYREDLQQYRNGESVRLARATDDTPVIIAAAKDLLSKVYKKGFLYKQAGVVLSDIEDGDTRQTDLFTVEEDERRRHLMEVADGINRRFGEAGVKFGGVGGTIGGSRKE